MSLNRRKLIAFLTIIALCVSLLPPIGEQARANTLYFTFSNLGDSPETAPQYNTNRIDVFGTFSGVSSSTIRYKVERIVDGQVVSSNESSAVPFIIGTNEFRFTNVELETGLNRITVTGINSLGNEVRAEGYAYFANVPAVYNIKLVDGRELKKGEPLIVNTPNLTLTLTAPNSNSVTVQGVEAMTGDGVNYVVTNVELLMGLNTIVIVASNDEMTYTIERQVIYYNGNPTAYHTNVVYESGGSTTRVSLDGNPTVGETDGSALTGEIEGYVAFMIDPSLPGGTLPDLALEIRDSGNNLIDTLTGVVDDTKTIVDDTYVSFYYRTDGESINITANDRYTIHILGNYGSQNMSYPVSFTFRNSSSPYITGIKQVYNPSVSGSTIAYTSSSTFTAGQTWFQLPVWLVVEANNKTGATYSLAVEQNGVTIGSPQFTYTEFNTQDGHKAFRINNMPSGEQVIVFAIENGGNRDEKRIPVTYVPSPAIKLTNMFTGKIFTANGNPSVPSDYNDKNKFTTIEGELVFFNLDASAPDLGSVELVLNGQKINLLAAGAFEQSGGNYTGKFVLDAVGNGLQLVPGANVLQVYGTGNGIDVSTEVTIYLFSDIVPIVYPLKPVPYVELPPANDDAHGRFVQTGEKSVTTHEKEADVLFSVQNVSSLTVTVDGVSVASATIDEITDVMTIVNPVGADTILVAEPRSANDQSVRKHNLRLRNLKLPNSGTTNVMVTVTRGGSTVSEYINITRELSPYIILSPKLPQERVINQNFLHVSIQAEGADEVWIDKQRAVRGENDIFRLELTGLKPGIKKVNFRILRGSQEIDGFFEVNYIDQPVVGAQYKTTMDKVGKMFVDKRTNKPKLTITFPKGTVLRRLNPNPGMPAPNTELFDSQVLLFGIADPLDGRTIKSYNSVGEQNASGEWLDGELIDIPASTEAMSWLQLPPRFAYASELFWTDGGYYVPVGLHDYTLVDGLHPYAPGNLFYLRFLGGPLAARMLEPVQPGTITIQYDPDIRDFAAQNLGIWRFVDNQWIPLGGKVDTKNKTVTAPFYGFGYYAVLGLRHSFNDVVGHEYARDDINLIYSRGIMKAKSVNEFGVYDQITRGEFVTMLVKILDIPLQYNESNMTFDDVPPIHLPNTLWDYRYIETAAKVGITTGKTPRLFVPNGFLTREEAVTMIARAMNLKMETNREKAERDLKKLFTDAHLADPYAYGAILAVNKLGIIVGKPNVLTEGEKRQTFRFDPKSNLSRADAAIIARRVMEYLKKL